MQAFGIRIAVPGLLERLASVSGVPSTGMGGGSTAERPKTGLWHVPLRAVDPSRGCCTGSGMLADRNRFPVQTRACSVMIIMSMNVSAAQVSPPIFA
jgi:hypothetical protein